MDGYLKNGFEVELSSALLEKILETFAEQVHHHHVVALVVFRFFVSHEVQVRHARYKNRHSAESDYSFLSTCG